jgi:UDP-N-acetylmuramoylalanine--D-glutamate ligase
MSFLDEFTGKIAVIGAGATGLSVVRFLAKHNKDIKIFDENPAAKQVEHLKLFFPEVGTSFGSYELDYLHEASLIVMSPGICPNDKIWQDIDKSKIISDIELFSHYVAAPVIAITGSNGKSTVAALLSYSLTKMGFNIALGANYGTPALQLLDYENIDYYILELSSFQLSQTHSLRPKISLFLNFSPDHLDWHIDLQDYLSAKQKIFTDATAVIVNRNDPDTYSSLDLQNIVSGFGMMAPGSSEDFGVVTIAGCEYLMHGITRIIARSDLPLMPDFQVLNYLAVYAIVASLGIAADRYSGSVLGFSSLEHRCQNIGKLSSRYWYNDSKATNCAATIAAVTSLVKLHGSVILLAGGVFKEDLVEKFLGVSASELKFIILFGQDAKKLYNGWQRLYHCVVVADMYAAIDLAYKLSESEDAVLLSPACASFDQFTNYKSRGDLFIDYVKKNF